ncbi:MAG TPA: class I SAM-dependent methyltransferase [Longimicrobiales bacterium]
MSSKGIIGLYERRAREYDRDRGRSLQERHWLDRFLEHVRPAGTVLDLGCGMGDPIARYLLDRGYHVLGVDTSATLVEMARTRLPGAEWLVADMRRLHLDRRFDGIIAWDSFFHLDLDDQRAMFARFAAHAEDGAPLMFTSGSSEGVAIGSYHGEPLYHASLSPGEYRDLLARNGFAVRAHRIDDPECGDHTVWLAIRRGETPDG